MRVSEQTHNVFVADCCICTESVSNHLLEITWIWFISFLDNILILLLTVFHSFVGVHTHIAAGKFRIDVISCFSNRLIGLHKHQQHNKQEISHPKNTKRTNHLTNNIILNMHIKRVDTQNKDIMINTRITKITEIYKMFLW